MRNLLEKYRPLFSPEDGGGNAPPAAPVAPAAGAQPAAPAAPGAPAAPAAPAPNAPPAVGTENQPYRPAGLHEQFHGKDDKETIDRLFAANKGYRDRDATRDLPDTAEGYMSLEGLKGDFKLDDAVKPYFEGLKADPAAKAMFDAAKAHGLDRGAVLDVWQKGMQAMQAAGILEPLVDPKAERAALLPESAKSLPAAQQEAAIEARLTANEDFVKLLMTQGLDKAAGDNALLMLMDTAAGNQFIEYVAKQMQGIGRDQPNGGGNGGAAGGGLNKAALLAEMEKPEMNPQHPKFDRAAYDALDEKFKRLYGDK